MIDEKTLINKLIIRREKLRYISVATLHNNMSYVDTIINEINSIIDIINEQPKVGEWIPCSEKLPKERSEAVLATAYDGISKAVYVFYYENRRWKDIDGYNVDAAEITAWMPTPEPWEGGKE